MLVINHNLSDPVSVLTAHAAIATSVLSQMHKERIEVLVKHHSDYVELLVSIHDAPRVGKIISCAHSMIDRVAVAA